MNFWFPILEKKKKDEQDSEDKRIPLYIYDSPEEKHDNDDKKNEKNSNNDMVIDMNKEFDIDFTIDLSWDCNGCFK